MARRVVIVAFDGCQLLDVAGPLEVFSAAREIQAGRGTSASEYSPLVVSVGRGPVRSASGLAIVPTSTLAQEAGAGIDTLIVAGGPGARRAAGDPRAALAVQRAGLKARRVASVCSGAFVLAAAGLLEGRRATTHWAFCDDLASAHPGVRVERDPIFVRDGKVWTSAGVTAGIDLSLALVEEDLGRDLALRVARWMVVFVRRAGGQAQFSAQLSQQLAERAPIRELQSWIVEHPESALGVPAMARRVGMSLRHFARVFRSEVGLSPGAYVERVRLETARRLLETSARSITDVAAATGFGTAEALRKSFARRLRLSPGEYRARFGR